MIVHLVDGTYELFRYHYGPGGTHRNAAGEEVGGTRRAVGSLLRLVEDGATHVAAATDHVVESFRNDLYGGYKSGEGLDPDILGQFPLLEETLTAAGFVVWPMVRHEADDGLASGAALLRDTAGVDEVVVASPDKDLAQCVDDDWGVVQWDRRRDIRYDRAGVVEKFGVGPESIADWLALVGDTADGFPGLPGWGAKSAATLLARWTHVESIPDDPDDWDVTVRGAAKLAASLADGRADAALFKDLATLRRDALEVEALAPADLDTLRWRGPTDALPALAARLDAPGLVERADALAVERA